MILWLAALIGLASLAALIFSAEKAVDKILALCHHFGLSTTFVGLTIFSLATSLPELFAHVAASVGILRGTLDYDVASATVVGANIGSDVFQQTFILGLVLFIAGAARFSKDFRRTAFYPMIGAAILVWILGLNGVLSRMDGVILLIAFVAYMAFLYFHKDKHMHEHHDETDKTVETPRKDTLFAALFLTIMLVSAHFLLESIEAIVAATALDASFIGAITLGVASASPELFTALSALRKKASGISWGTLIGSNITNPVLALGVGAVISSYSVPYAVWVWDLPLKIVSALILIPIIFFSAKHMIGRKTAIYLIACYALFLLVRILFFAL